MTFQKMTLQLCGDPPEVAPLPNLERGACVGSTRLQTGLTV